MILKIAGLQKSYAAPEGKLTVLKSVDLTINEAEMVYITGRSGSGKSTLLHILGLLDTYNKGDFSFLGKSVRTLKENAKCEARNSAIGFVFQFYNLLPELTVLENVMLPALMYKRKNAKKHAQELLDQVGIIDRRSYFPYQLSGGEQQRVALVRALINNPKIVFCDEPTGNLDEENSVRVMGLIRELHRERSQTFCIVTHDEQLAQTGTHSYNLRGGKLHVTETIKT